jgi:LysM repeat protein
VSRKDTIIVAVLINTGLLIILFASALKSGGSEQTLVTHPEPLIEEVSSTLAKKETPVVVGDEVDLALQQFAANAQVAAVEVNPFVEDLKAITLPIESVSAPTAQTLVAPLNAAPEFKTVTVKKGDVLEKIARHHHSSVTEIMKANHLKSSNLRIGQVLKIPTQMATTLSERMYTVKSGDSPWTIAVKHQMKVADLLKINNLSEAQAKRLKPGDQLRVQ